MKDKKNTKAAEDPKNKGKKSADLENKKKAEVLKKRLKGKADPLSKSLNKTTALVPYNKPKDSMEKVLLNQVKVLINDKINPDDRKYMIKEDIMFADCNFVHLLVRMRLTPKGQTDLYSADDIDAPAYIHKISDIAGVEEVFVDKYEVSIFKSSLFSWDEILPEAKQILLDYLKSL